MGEESRRVTGAVPGAVPETFVFGCAGCGHVWQAVFQVVFFTDPVSLYTQEYVDEAGRALRSPLADAVCPRCGGRQVDVTTPERAADAARGDPRPNGAARMAVRRRGWWRGRTHRVPRRPSR